MNWRVEELECDQRANALWDQYVTASPTVTGYHLTAWRKVIEEVFGHQTLYLAAKDDGGNIRGILPSVLSTSRMFGKFLTSMPFLNYGGIDVTDGEAILPLADALSRAADRLNVRHAELRQSSALPVAWPCKKHKVSMRLSLPESPDALMSGFPSKLRSQIRRPSKEGMVAQVGGIEFLDDFYGVFSRNMRDLGTPVYGKAFFRKILETFPKEAAVATVTLKGTTTAAGFVYRFRNMMEIPWASSDQRYDRLSPNMLLYSTVLEYACRQGCRVFDFGRSTVDSGTYRFKQQWGAKPTPLYWYYWLNGCHEMPELNPDNPRYRMAISLWRRLPLPVANVIGPRIVKYLP
ncbi:FemAB-related protein, PEP-CTERM system-associated [Nitrospira sp. KM1]|uniref:FemAB family XrtA/PEP-CTERM system-associated protein n=1 Tax=Nitrospira sp. KM1 TaxID=1936990 RepID=UPI0013A7ACCC|nr:FemAB family XrtA/PEP-CTERM system-associated protein [Nitrospira sp. KM1]BCA54107.1 FemAB-related protein, PEP-CTERM system-associated [Nitrospira sp. KM1]